MLRIRDFPDELLLRAVWGGRKNPLDEQVEMVWQFWQKLATYGGFMANEWNWVDDDPVRLPTIDALRATMTARYERDHDFMYHFTQNTYDGSGSTPVMSMSATLSYPDGWKKMVANRVFMELNAGVARDGTVQAPLPVDWLLEIGAELMADMVQVWHPDAVSLDCGALMRVPNRPRFVYPAIGFVSWLSDSVVDPELLPDAAVKRRFGEGTILGIDPGSSDPLADALALADQVYSAGILSMVPFVQGQPNPES